VVISTPPAELLDEVGLPSGAGTYIAGVVPDGPAWQAGLEPGQVVTHVDGIPMAHWLDFIAAVSWAPPGTVLDLTVAEPGRARTIQVTLGSPPSSMDYRAKWEGAHAAAIDGLTGGNKATAIQELSRLAREDHGPSQSRFGVLFDRGDGVGRDGRQALTWYRVAASQGRARAAHRLAAFFERGAAGRPDPVRAYHYFNVAASRGDIRAANERARLAKTLGSEGVLRAQALARFAPFAADEAAEPKRVATTGTADAAPPRAGTGKVAGPGPSIDPATVAQIQRSLSMLGYDPGPADGQMGPRTRTAIAAYQRSAGLAADGRPTEGLAAHLQGALGSKGGTGPATATSGTSVGRQPPPPPSSPPPKETDSLLLPDLPALDE